MKKRIKIALEGNPNTGKTTFLNTLTGLNQHVGNWPGKTVEKVIGRRRFKGMYLEIIDLPGIYSLTSYTPEERIARDYILNGNPDVVVDIIDAENLERNLYLTLQTLELTKKVVVILNMNKRARKKGITIDHKILSKLLGVPVIPFEANSKEGMNDLLEVIVAVAEGRRRTNPLRIKFNSHMESNIKSIESKFRKTVLNTHFNNRWLAINLLEKDDDIRCLLEQYGESDAIAEADRIHSEELHHDPAIEIADGRYQLISSIISAAMKIEGKTEDLSEKIDNAVTNKWFGLPIMFFIFGLLFMITFNLSAPLMNLINSCISLLKEISLNYLSATNIPDILVNLIVDGIITGVGSVLAFLPLIAIFFLLFAILEDIGYLSRAAFVIDRIMHVIGLQGRSFLCLLLGYGCNVPAIMSTRTLKEKKDRMITILLNPFVPCEARLGVMVLIVSIFFTGIIAATVITLALVLNLFILIISAFIFKKYLFKGEHSVFIMEMPPYRVPNSKTVLITTWYRVKSFLYRAGTLIFVASIVIWFLSTFPLGTEFEDTYAGILGKILSPLGAVMGFDWKIMLALLFGFGAKEMSISTLSILYASGTNMVFTSVLQHTWTPLIAITFVIVQMIYIPCLATIAIIKKETNSWKWTIFSVAYSLVLAFLVGAAIYNIGSLLGF
jgi:ferrous iron transport protein B